MPIPSKAQSVYSKRSDKIDLAATTLLLGSGISQPSGYPLTAEITHALLSNNWLFERDQAQVEIPLYSPLHHGSYGLRNEALSGLIRILRSHVDQHLAIQGKAESNYEDIYYMARQVLDALRGEYDNPGLLPLMFDLRAKVSLMIDNLNAAYGRDGISWELEKVGLEGLLERCIDFIEEAVARQLAPRKDILGLDFLLQLLATCADHRLHLVSLNHDTLLENFLATHVISDGFIPISADAAEFSPSSFDSDHLSRVRLLKLHGSINWFRYKSKSGDDIALKVISSVRNHVKRNGKDLMSPQNRLMLAGTTNKELAYGSGVFIELMYHFQKRLKETELLIVSGYGFADKGINNRLWAWLDSRPDNRLVVLHADIGKLRRYAKPSFSHNMDRHKTTGKFVLVDKWMCDCSLDDVRREMRCATAGESEH